MGHERLERVDELGRDDPRGRDDERAACGDLGSGTRRCTAGLVAGEGYLLEFVVLDELGLHILHQEASL